MPSNTIVMKKDKDCKHSVRYAVPDGAAKPDEPAAVENVYVSRLVLPRPVPEEIIVSVSWEDRT